MRPSPRGKRAGAETPAAAPHLRPTRVDPPFHAPNAALLIDFDNVTLGIRSDLTKELKTLLGSEIIKGKVAVQRAYADWRRYPQYVVPLSESSIDLIFAPAMGSTKKNATDIRLAIDAIELVFTRPEIGTFMLLSGDSDFSSLVVKLKEYGKYVIGVGIRESASDLLIQNCDEYYSYSDLAGLTKEADVPSIQRDPWELVQEAVAQMARNRDVMRSDRLKQVMQQLDANFDERVAGFNRFSKFVAEAGSRGLLKVSKLDNGQFEVAPTDGGAIPSSTAPGEASLAPAGEGTRNGAAPAEDKGERDGRRRGRRGRGRGDRERGPASDTASARPAASAPSTRLSLARAFDLMRDALRQLDTPVQHEALRLRMSALLGHDDALLEQSRFTRLLRQANDAEVADVRKLGDDDYEISPHPTDDPRARTGIPLRPLLAEAADSAESPARSASAAPPAAPAPRFGLRSRPSRTARPMQIPLIGVVEMEEPAGAMLGEAVRADVPDAEAEAEVESKPVRTRSRRGGRGGAKKSAKAAAPTEARAAAPATPAADAAKKPRRPRGGRGRKPAAKGKNSEPAG